MRGDGPPRPKRCAATAREDGRVSYAVRWAVAGSFADDPPRPRRLAAAGWCADGSPRPGTWATAAREAGHAAEDTEVAAYKIAVVRGRRR